MHAVQNSERLDDGYGLDRVSAEFAGQIAAAVWLGKLSEEAAREALWSYAMACHLHARQQARSMLAAMTAEYRRRCEQLDVCW